MLTVAVLAYLIFTVFIGVYASSRVHGAKDFMVAGRSLPLYMTFTCVFATWFGAETVLSVSATFARDGLAEIPGDPFGFSMCLVFVAVFFARAFYRMDLLTIGDFYEKRFGKSVELFTSLAITLSYLGWTAAQLTALGLVMLVLGQGAGLEWLTLNQCIFVGAFLVMFYTVLGGMWSVALTDMIQTFVIIIGLIVVAFLLAQVVENSSGDGVAEAAASTGGGFSTALAGVRRVFSHASEAGKLNPLPTGGFQVWMVYIAGFLTAALGSIPQQDVFQRVTSAKDEKTAIRGTLLGGGFYFVFAFVPMFIAYSAVVLDESYLELFGSEDERLVQRILPELIMAKTPIWAQALFLGALLSAILSTASGTLLAPSSLFTENVLRPLFPKATDGHMLTLLRIILVLFACAATYQAISSNKTMYQMVQAAYSVTLVGALVPLALGIYWSRATTQGAILSIAFGLAVWLICLFQFGDEALIPPQLIGLGASIAGMVIGSVMPQFMRDERSKHPQDETPTAAN